MSQKRECFLLNKKIHIITADVLQTVWNELDFHVDVCRNTNGANIPVRYVTKTWSVVLSNKKIYIHLSQVYCV